MSKQLYEEALADVKKIKEIAEDNAKRAVVEAVAPRIRELIEKELLGENAAGEQSEKAPEEEDDEDNKILTDEKPSAASVSSGANTAPKLEGVFFLSDLKKNVQTERKFTEQLESIENLLVSKNSSQLSEAKLKEVAQSLDALYKSVKQNVDSPAQRLSYNLKINNCLKKVEKLQENKNMKNRKSRLDEAEITLKLTGVPDELEDELDGLGVELVAGEEPEGEESEDAELDLDVEDEGDTEGDAAADDLLGGGEDEEGGEEEEEVEEMSMPEAYGESRRLSDNVIVEIDEGMLRREISKMRALREADETKPQSWGHGPGDVSDEFADEEMEVLDVELTTENDAPLGEDDVNEEDENKDPSAKPEGAKCESLRRQMANELKLQESYKAKASRAARLYENAQAQFNKAKTLAERKNVNTAATQYKAAYTNFAKRYNESVKRFNKLSQDLAEASRPQSTRSNNVARPAASSGNSTQLRNKLAETNLLNAKLMFTNKLLQSEALTARQKSQVIAQLDEAKTLREVKLVYESLAKTLAAPRKPVTESRVIGSSSQATRSASPQTLNEGFEAERWAKLAGISK